MTFLKCAAAHLVGLQALSRRKLLWPWHSWNVVQPCSVESGGIDKLRNSLKSRVTSCSPTSAKLSALGNVQPGLMVGPQTIEVGAGE